MALLWMPSSPPAELPGVVTVDLVALAPAAVGRPAPPAPVQPKPLPPAPAESKPVPPPQPVAELPKPEPPPPEPPKPEPPPPPPPPKNETVIPKTPEREPEKPKAKPEPEPKPKPEPKPPPKEVAKVEPPKPPPVAKPPPPKPKPQESYDDVLADLRAERGEHRPERVERPARSEAKPSASENVATPGAPAAGSASMSPEVASWVKAARVHVGQAWVLPAGLRREPLETQIEVELDAQGNVLAEPKVTRRSGNPWYDESVVRAVKKASPLPPPPGAGTWSFVFRPEDLG